MEEAEEQCQRLAVMCAGRIRAEGSPAELRSMGAQGGTLEDVFVELTSESSGGKGDFRGIDRTRRTARRLG